MNQVTLRGGLTRDPEIKEFDWGTKVDFTLAVNGTRYDRHEGKQVVKSNFFACQAFGNVADELAGYALEKGDEVLVLHGELDQVRKDDDDKPHTRVTVFAFSVVRKRPRAPKPMQTDTAPQPIDDPWATQ